MLGHMDSLRILPERADIHDVRSLDAVDLHRLFQPPEKFHVEDRDPLIYAFANYTWILSFLGEPGSDFEKNLIFAVHCSHGAEIVTLSLKPPADYGHHVTAFYLEQFATQNPTLEAYPLLTLDQQTLRPTATDRTLGLRLLEKTGVDLGRPLTVIHPGSGGSAKCWHLDNFLAVAEQWQQDGGHVVFVIGPVEQERWTQDTIARLEARAPLLRELTLEQTLAVLSNAATVLTNDSGISHLAAGLGLPTTVLFGPTAPHLYRPVGPQVRFVHCTDPNFAQRASPTDQQRVWTVLTQAN
jgi:hypothetical protein